MVVCRLFPTQEDPHEISVRKKNEDCVSLVCDVRVMCVAQDKSLNVQVATIRLETLEQINGYPCIIFLFIGVNWYLNEQAIMKQKADSSRGVYEFSDLNPYVGHPDPMREGQELFHKGLLSETDLALVAEV
ncbi:hypothetical protein Tco_0802313 [Tanacetum coccineum]|uniref:Uncharacterized protein n=1 Tax=Tanacetum coccineum TaxID=301880 RepID=A0ABQ4ZZC9_9ASTR